LVVMFVLGCSDSGSSGGCGSTSATERCQINTTSTACGDRITVECFAGAIPDAQSQCDLALEQADMALYCCTSAVEEVAADEAEDGGGGGVGGS
jgi:hypothetical protein